jgi:hypothetical protein
VVYGTHPLALNEILKHDAGRLGSTPGVRMGCYKLFFLFIFQVALTIIHSSKLKVADSSGRHCSDQKILPEEKEPKYYLR